jgi:putative colanic acid biosysnthesis UDP-glucose lipid carrier transferase
LIVLKSEWVDTVVVLQQRSDISFRGKFPISSHVIPGLIVVLDSVAIFASALILYGILVGGSVESPDLYFAVTIFVWLATVLLMNFAGLYQFESILRPISFIDKIVLTFMTTFLFLLAAAFSIKVSATFSRLWIGSFALGACVATLGLRVAAAEAVKRLADVRMFTRNVVIVGAGDQAKSLLAFLDETPARFITVLGVFGERSPDRAAGVGRFPILGEIGDIDAFVRDNVVDDVIIALPWSADKQVLALVNKLRELPVNVYLSPDLIGFRLPFRPPPEHFGDVPLVEVMGQPLVGWGKLQKGLLDYTLSLALVVPLLPVMALVAIAIKLDSNGPVLFRQKRYGFVNKVFEIYKFRTMRHEDTNCADKTIQATRYDPRVTRVGRFLRRTSLDELPQLFNVLNGTMSLVGPRPHAIDHNEQYSQMIRGYFARHRVKPGITGWAQVNGHRGETKTVEAMEARIKHDIHYVENWSLLFDVKILVKTVVICITRRNAY